MGRVGGALLGAALGAFMVLKLKEARSQAAVTQLWALLASKADPSTLTAAEVGAPFAQWWGTFLQAAGAAAGSTCPLPASRVPCKRGTRCQQRRGNTMSCDC